MEQVFGVIQIHRSKPVARVDWRPVRLSPAEYRLLVALGMLDNKLAPVDLLIETALAQPTHRPNDRDRLWMIAARLRKKIGSDRLQSRPNFGYMLLGDVHFYG